MTKVTVNASKSYDILIDSGILKEAGQHIRRVCNGSSACLVCGDTVDGIYGDAVSKSLAQAGYAVNRFVYPHGEQSKNAGTYIELLNHMADSHMTRADLVVALGGGVTGDLAGFAAATYMRGIKYVQIPTTLLAMVDSSVGGKTAIDLAAGKNLAGAFHQPELVLCDCKTLDTLPENFFRDGCAEVVKYGVLRDGELLELLKDPRAALEQIVTKCVTIKRDTVEADEFDLGERQKLNLGHTVGHAVEKLSDFSVTHGSAVAIGLAIIARAANANGDCDEKTVDIILNALKSLRLPSSTDFTAERLSEIMLSDKKRDGNMINLIIPRKIGDCEIRAIQTSALKAYIEKGLMK